ncbi:GNAT family N-acetyltransferase [Alkalimonas collagenimarina]|uniref:GNAT family N-acetyltransferase n=1 Tax=Alkalimonas collagenimarina TaxID=400390 RepID=A0ABT9H0D2_9GAMM|nr:GNAT family N-acetyltransferase [Alkalimonas collagenimarina]MDP4536781.1 GNAT family N-acetyltransferase [Alkalimonas collagenimarina]
MNAQQTANETPYQLKCVGSLTEIAAEAWNALFPADYPFTQHAFLLALEQGGSIGRKTGWLPQYLLLWREHTLIAAMPAYIKLHSYGEYLFDWSIAEAYQQHGLGYYPKLVLAIPFTPAEGPRIGLHADTSGQQVMGLLQAGMQQLVERYQLSNVQCLYPDPKQQSWWAEQGYLQRYDVQFQWLNNGYKSFSDFLAAFTSRKRKQIRKERARVAEQGISIRTLQGTELDDAFWQQFVRFYQQTYLKRSGHLGYLTADTFQRWGQHMRDSIVVFAAYHQQQLIAASLCFRSEQTLYGRYWGCAAEYDFLHFETCYYAGIEYCIAHQLAKFDAGAQGEHKLQRGFEPVLRSGFYRFQASPLSAAIERYCLDEQQMLKRYMDDAKQQLPYRLSD